MTWDTVRQEIARATAPSGSGPQDVVRREKIAAVEEITGIPLIIYVVDFTDEGRASQYGAGLQIELSDKTGFMQALSDITDGPLDVLIHSPGGIPSAAESIVHLLRSRFSPIRFLIPHTAKSAATMLVLSGDEIFFGEGAELGPIDPQLRITIDQRPVNVPAGAAIDQFSRIHADVVQSPDKLRGWMPLLRQYGPSFLQECRNAIDLSETLVANWLQKYMFSGEENAESRAQSVAKWLAHHENFKSHSRPVWLQQLLDFEPTLKIKRFRDVSQDFEDAVMALYWAIDITFDTTSAFKIVEHKQGSAYVRLQQQVVPQSQIIGKQAKSPAKQKRNRRKSRH